MKDFVMTINSVQKSSKSRLSSKGKRPFKVLVCGFFPQTVPTLISAYSRDGYHRATFHIWEKVGIIVCSMWHEHVFEAYRCRCTPRANMFSDIQMQMHAFHQHFQRVSICSDMGPCFFSCSVRQTEFYFRRAQHRG